MIICAGKTIAHFFSITVTRIITTKAKPLSTTASENVLERITLAVLSVDKISAK